MKEPLYSLALSQSPLILWAVKMPQLNNLTFWGSGGCCFFNIIHSLSQQDDLTYSKACATSRGADSAAAGHS